MQLGNAIFKWSGQWCYHARILVQGETGTTYGNNRILSLKSYIQISRGVQNQKTFHDPSPVVVPQPSCYYLDTPNETCWIRTWLILVNIYVLKGITQCFENCEMT